MLVFTPFIQCCNKGPGWSEQLKKDEREVRRERERKKRGNTVDFCGHDNVYIANP